MYPRTWRLYTIVHACLDLIALSARYTPLPSVTLVSRRAWYYIIRNEKYFLQGKDTGEVVATVSLRRHCAVLKALAACYSHCLLHRSEKFALRFTWKLTFTLTIWTELIAILSTVSIHVILIHKLYTLQRLACVLKQTEYRLQAWLRQFHYTT